MQHAPAHTAIRTASSAAIKKRLYGELAAQHRTIRFSLSLDTVGQAAPWIALLATVKGRHRVRRMSIGSKVSVATLLRGDVLVSDNALITELATDQDTPLSGFKNRQQRPVPDANLEALTIDLIRTNAVTYYKAWVLNGAGFTNVPFTLEIELL
jgi:hypothetical protein